MRVGTTPATSFVGRRRELAALSRLLRSTRLLTIAGGGGSGKTRLAGALVGRIRKRPVAWVDLAEIREPSGVSPAIERAIGALGDGMLRTENVAAALRNGPQIIVLDNCEHVIDRCRDATARLLGADAQVRIVATSRVPLGLMTELVWRAPPLSLPDAAELDGLGHGIRADAVKLFVERARGARSEFALDDSTAVSVGEICRRLEGLPLAIELAAARLRHMPLAELADRIGSLEMLTGGESDLTRHRTMTATLDWSYELLDEQGRFLLRRLSVFAGSFTTASAKAVSGKELPDALTAVGSLVDKSLVEFLSNGRYRLLEPVRQYAEDRLRERLEVESAIEPAARYLLTLATDSLGVDSGVPSADLRIRDEFANVAAVMPWLVRNDSAGALRLMTRFADRHRAAVPVHLSVVSSWLERALDAHPSRDRARAEALVAWANMTWSTDRDGTAGEAARQAAASALATALDIGDEQAETKARFMIATLAFRYASPEQAIRTYDDVIPRLVHPRMVAFARSGRSVLRQMVGDPAGAREDLREAFAAWDRHGDPLVTERASTMLCAAEIAFLSGEPEEAAAHLRQAIAARRLSGEPHEPAPFELLAHVAALAGDGHRALRLAGIADRLRQELGTWAIPWFRLADRSWLPDLERELGAKAASLRSEGRGMSIRVAVAYALGERTSTALTEREEAVARLVADGLTDKEIGARLRMSQRTAENHVQRVRDKLGLRSRAQIARWIAQQMTSGGIAGGAVHEATA